MTNSTIRRLRALAVQTEDYGIHSYLMWRCRNMALAALANPNQTFDIVATERMIQFTWIADFLRQDVDDIG